MIVNVAARDETERIDNITLQPAPNSGSLRVAICKVGLLPEWAPPMSESLAWIAFNVTAGPTPNPWLHPPVWPRFRFRRRHGNWTI